MDCSDLANHLMDIEHAGARRCEVCAALLESGPPQAELVLQAAEHRAAAAALNDAVVRLRGTPQSGDADTVLRDPAGPGFPTDAQPDHVLLDNCIAETEGAAQVYRQALDGTALPEWLRRLLDGRLASTQRQLDRLRLARAAGRQPLQQS